MNQFGAGPSQPASSESLFPGFPALDIGRLIHLVKKRLWLAAAVAGGFVLLAILYLIVTPSVYTSFGQMYVNPKSDGTVFGSNFNGVRNSAGGGLDALKSFEGGLTSGDVILRTVETLKLGEDPDFQDKKGNSFSNTEFIEVISKQASAKLVQGTRNIVLSVNDTSPERAQRIAQALIDEFQGLLQDQNTQASEGVKERLEAEATLQYERLKEIEDQLREFRMKHADIALDEAKDFAVDRLTELERQLSLAENETLRLKSQNEQLLHIDSKDIERVFEIGGYKAEKSIQDLLTARTNKRVEFAKIQAQYTQSHPTYRNYKLELDSLEEQVKNAAFKVADSIRVAYNSAVEHENQLRQSLKEQKAKHIDSDSVRKDYYLLEASKNTARSAYDKLVKSINDVEVTKGIDETVIQVWDSPKIPAKPTAPKKKITVIIAGVFGSMCGLGLVIGMGLLDRSLNTRKQVEDTLGLSVLAQIPKAFDKEWDLRDAVFVTREPSSVVSEGFRSLRTALSSHSPRSVMITSASPSEGKSFCAANLAVLQANMGYRTLLVDADFCKPRMASIFVDPLRGNQGQAGLATQNLCEETVFKDLFLLSCGRYTSNTGEPMSGEIFARMLNEAYGAFDCIIIDSSPLNVVSDGLTYSRHADAVVMVVRAGQTQTDGAQHAMRELQRMRANLVGCVLNASTEQNPEQMDYVQGTTRTLQTNSGMRYPANAT